MPALDHPVRPVAGRSAFLAAHLGAQVGEGGRDSDPIEWSMRRLRELELPPFERALVDAGARSVMAAYNSVDGAPASASRWLLHDLLRAHDRAGIEKWLAR